MRALIFIFQIMTLLSCNRVWAQYEYSGGAEAADASAAAADSGSDSSSGSDGSDDD